MPPLHEPIRKYSLQSHYGNVRTLNSKLIEQIDEDEEEDDDHDKFKEIDNFLLNSVIEEEGKV